MQTIFEIKEQAIVDTPLLVFDCVLPNGQTERWSTHRVTVNGNVYENRVLQHNVFELQTATDQGVDGIPKITVVLANADSHFSELERGGGVKGARIEVGFLFYDLRNDVPLTDTSVLFQGICNPPDEIREATFRMTATNRMNLQRLLLPQVRIQRRCPWDFPATTDQRTEAKDGGTNGKYSRYYRCGYSADITGGFGTVGQTGPYSSCGYTRTDCSGRGMSLHFGGIEYVPPATSVRTYGDKNWHISAISVNSARYNDFVPLVYGTAWYTAPVVFGRNDGNLTRMEVLLGIGEMQGVLKVLVSDVEIPAGVAGMNMTGTGWYNTPTLGTRDGKCNPDFTDASGQPAGDPYGSMAYLSVVVPNRLNDGTSLPIVKVLVQGLKVPVYAGDGSEAGEQFSSNPAWILLDILRRAGWATTEIDIPSFAAAAAYCDEPINALDLYGNPISLPRFQCNLAIQTRRSAGDLVRGVRNAARLLLSYGTGGVLQLRVENSLALEQGVKPDCSNSTEQLNGGWPHYEFGDGSNGFSGILRRASGEPAVRVYARSIADTPNRFSVEFQDAMNDYQQDSLSLSDPDDVARSGQEVSAALAALGLPNYDQAGRICKVSLDKSVRGNIYVEFDTSVRCLGVKPGDIITVTYLKEGFNRQTFRVLKMAPGMNHRVTTITAQIHDDSWYADSNGQATSAPGGTRQGSAVLGIPKPLLGTVVDGNGDIQFGVTESTYTSGDGTVEANVEVSFVSPAIAGGVGPGIPIVSLAAQTGSDGTLKGGQTLYYAITGSDSAENEGQLSFIVPATLQRDNSSVTLTGLSFAPGTAAFQVYRGSTPAALFRIASNVTPAAQFTDTGLPEQLVAPPDANFDHANLYWRMELQPESPATTHSPNTVGGDALAMVANRYRGMTARITRGRGAGQERTVASNTPTILTIAPAWDIEPDSTSYFVVAESSWRFGALAKASPAQFGIPNRSGEVVHLSGRAANANDEECAAEISIVTRWQISGSGAGGGDSDVPPKPLFGLGLDPQGGLVNLTGVSFADLTNTKSISSGTLAIYYWDELQAAPQTALTNSVGATDTSLSLTGTGPASAGGFIQVEAEVMQVTAVQPDGLGYEVSRGVHGTIPVAHAEEALVYSLQRRTIIAAFPADFFGSPYSGSWSYGIPIPDVRVASAELFVTNALGNSETASIYLTHNDDNGLRTLSGGQYSMQVEGYLAVDQNPAPAVVVEASHAVRDVFAVLGSAADGPVQLQISVDGAAYCTLTFPAGGITSNTVDGKALSFLKAGSKVTMAVQSVGTANPGADLTALIRL